MKTVKVFTGRQVTGILSALPSAEAVGEDCDHCVYKWSMKGGESHD